MIKRKYEDEFKKRLVKLHIEEGRSMESIKKEYNLSHGILNQWVKNYREEGLTNQNIKKEMDVYEELNRIKKAYAELEKENAFLKKAAAFFAKEID